MRDNPTDENNLPEENADIDKSADDGAFLDENSTIFVKKEPLETSGEPPKKTIQGRGYGSRILSDFAARYNGDYRTEYKDGIYTAVVSLLAVGEV
jgi:hypothetical protein